MIELEYLGHVVSHAVHNLCHIWRNIFLHTSFFQKPLFYLSLNRRIFLIKEPFLPFRLFLPIIFILPSFYIDLSFATGPDSLPTHAIFVAAKITDGHFVILINGMRDLLVTTLSRWYTLRITEVTKTDEKKYCKLE